MACVIVPTVEAIAVTAAALIVKHHEHKVSLKNEGSEKPKKASFSNKLFRLSYLLFGGAALLAFEHVWHGEITLSFPFLTAIGEGPEAVSQMLLEMGTAGVGMALLCTAVWSLTLAVEKLRSRRSEKAKEGAK